MAVKSFITAKRLRRNASTQPAKACKAFGNFFGKYSWFRACFNVGSPSGVFKPKCRFSKGPFKLFQHLPNIRSTEVERVLGKCWMNGVFKRFQRNSPFSRNFKGNVESMLNENLNQFKFDSTRFHQLSTFYTFNNVDDLFKRPRYLVQQSVEHMLKQN